MPFIALLQILLMVSLRGQNEMFCLSFIFFPDQIPNIKICHMFASKHPEVIKGRRRLISTDIPDSKEASEDGSIDTDGAYLDEEDESGLVESGNITCVIQSVTEEVKEVQRFVKSSSLSSFMLKSH